MVADARGNDGSRPGARRASQPAGRGRLGDRVPGSGGFDPSRREEAVLEQLRLRITDQLAARAGENIALVRELGRRRTADFVRTFLLSQFGEDVEAYRIEVRFRDEVDIDSAVDPGPPVTEGARD